MTRLRTAAIGAGTACVIAVGSSNHVASDAATAMIMTVGVVIVLAVLGLLALLIYRARRPRLTYWPDPAITRTWARAEVLGTVPTRTPLALPSAPERPGDASARATSAGHDGSPLRG
jgi:heme/copper-type cytochrome/quinol oxidase subunit 2